ncbi:MAG: phosphatase PAP2 family protein [Ilumatobacter sp.]|nr:phosphatase PAP2 family protein [Ilumatobacter sp.]
MSAGTGVAPALGQEHADSPRWWTESPIDRRGALAIVAGYVALTVVLTVVGVLVVSAWEGSWFGRRDADISVFFADRRTPTWTTLSDVASMPSDTVTMVGASVVLLPVFLWSFRRWHDWVFLVGALIIEVTTFLTTSTLVGRERPPVEQLDGAPTDSFPSGHVAAAVVFYVGLAVVVSWHTRNRWIRLPFIALAVVAPLMVMASRLYRGMHYVTDELGGLTLGLAALAVMWFAIDRGARGPLDTADHRR